MPTNYKKLSNELDEILSSLQSGNLGVDEAVKNYQRGMVIAGELQKYLKEAENKVTKVKKSFE
jgi:exodeoxyribonuclease VII small subunit